MDVKKYRIENGLTRAEIIAAVRAQYPRYSKVTQCMVENPKSYGVGLLPEAEALLPRSPKNARKQDAHRNKYRLSCRVTKTRYDEVKQAIEQDGRFTSVQAWLDWWIYVWLKNRAAPDGANIEGGNARH